MSDIPAHRPLAAASGTLAKTPAVHLLLYALERGLAGTVEFGAPGAPPLASLLFLGGRPSKARTAEPVAYLGRVLLELGHISEDALTRSLTDLARAKSAGPALHGQILLAVRAITPDQLQAGLGDQLARMLRHIAALPPETSYAYYDGFDGLARWGLAATEGFDPVPMIWGMLRESPPQSHVSVALERVGSSPLRIARGAMLSRLGLGDEQRTLAELLGSRPMRLNEMLSASDLGEQDTRLLLYLLLVTKQVELLRPVDRPAETPSKSAISVAGARLPPTAAAHRPPSSATMAAVSPKRRTPAPMASVAQMPAAPVAAPSPIPPPAGARSSVPPGLSRELAERWADIRDRAATIDRSDYFAMLDLARDATHEEVESAFFTLAKKWHPDRLPPELNPVRPECSRVFSRMSEAHATLADSEQRARYMQLLAEGSGSPETRDTVLKVVEAATNFQKAEVCLRRHDYVQAESLCRRAVDADATQPDYLAMLAWLIALKPENHTPERTRESIQMLDRAIELNARCEKAHFWRGMLNKRMGKADTAFRDFKTAVELNPRNIDAAREVRLFRMRRGGRSSSPPPLTGRSGPPAGRSVPPGSARPTSNSPKVEEAKPGLLGRLFKKQ